MTTVGCPAAFLADAPIDRADFDAATLAGRTRRSPLRTRPLIRSRPDRHDARRALAVAAYQLGRAAHTLILEGREAYERGYAIGGPVNPCTGQPFAAGTKAAKICFSRSATRVGPRRVAR